MQAIHIVKTGGPEALVYSEVSRPSPKVGEALIAVEAIGVNFIDIYFREGRYPLAAAVYPRSGSRRDRRRSRRRRHHHRGRRSESPGAASLVLTPSSPLLP